MTVSRKTKRFAALIARQRTRPRIWDYSYLLLRNNAAVFRVFAKMVAERSAAGGGRFRILDVGCGFKPWAALCPEDVRYVGIDHDRSLSAADALASGDALPFAEGTFDALIYSEVLEHAADLAGTLKEMRRVARDGALVYASAPFVFYEHGVPEDYQRLTQYFYRAAFRDDGIAILKRSNSSLATAIAAVNLALDSTPFSLLPGIRHVVYGCVNMAARVADIAVGALARLVGNERAGALYSMPLGYAMIVRIRK